MKLCLLTSHRNTSKMPVSLKIQAQRRNKHKQNHLVYSQMGQAD